MLARSTAQNKRHSILLSDRIGVEILNIMSVSLTVVKVLYELVFYIQTTEKHIYLIQTQNQYLFYTVGPKIWNGY